MPGSHDLRFDNSFARLAEGFHARVAPTPLDGARLIGASPRAARLLGLRFRDDNFENAVAARCRDVLAVDAVRQREAAHEDAMRTLDALVALLALCGLVLALALDRQHALVHGYLYVLGLDAGNVGVQQITVGLFLDVDGRRPVTALDAAGIVAAIGHVKHVIQLLVPLIEQAPRISTYNHVHVGLLR